MTDGNLSYSYFSVFNKHWPLDLNFSTEIKLVGWNWTYLLGVCVCVSVFIFFHHEGFFQLQDVQDMLERYRSMILCCEYSSGCFCQVPSSLFPNLSYFISKDVTPACRKTGEKMIWYTVLSQKDDIYRYRSTRDFWELSGKK